GISAEKSSTRRSGIAVHRRGDRDFGTIARGPTAAQVASDRARPRPRKEPQVAGARALVTPGTHRGGPVRVASAPASARDVRDPPTRVRPRRPVAWDFRFGCAQPAGARRARAPRPDSRGNAAFG